MRVAGLGDGAENMRRSIAARNAASVFPDPVGARTRALSPAAIAGHASSCARVGAANVASNHARVAGLKVASGSLPTTRMPGVRERKGPPRGGPFWLRCGVELLRSHAEDRDLFPGSGLAWGWLIAGVVVHD